MTTKEAIATGCGWCGSEAAGVKGKCRDCGGKLGVRAKAAKAQFARDDAARRADPLLGNPGAADAFRELWLGPVVLGACAAILGASALASGVSVSRGGQAAMAEAMRFGGVSLMVLGSGAVAGGLLLRTTRLAVIAKVMAAVWCLGFLALCPVLLRAGVLGGHPVLLVGVVGMAFGPIVRATQLTRFLE